MIIPLYEAKTIFANIDAVVDAAFAFLHDLELATVDSIAEICTKHVSTTMGGCAFLTHS